MKLKIATHDSASGEKPKNLLSWLVIPFARTQSKTIREQFVAGCTNFDIRVKEVGDEWYCAHGIFKTKRTAEDILNEISLCAIERNIYVHVSITYEGKGTNNDKFLEKVHFWKSTYSNIYWGGIAVKYGDGSNLTKIKYTYLESAEPGYEGGVQGFLPLDGRTWHIYLPIPWLWDMIYKRPHVFNEKQYIYVDFL